jgi:hypothetical protein
MGHYTINAQRDVNIVDKGDFYQNNRYINNQLNTEEIKKLTDIKDQIDKLIDIITLHSVQTNIENTPVLNELFRNNQRIEQLINNTANAEDIQSVKQFFISMQERSSNLFNIVLDIKDYDEVLEWIIQKSSDVLTYL